MKKMIFISILFVFLFSSMAYGEYTEYTDYAEQLKSIGVFKGTENGFELEREATRVEGLIMFIRLLGQESEALEQDWSHPFQDVPGWADQYIGWAYQNGYTKGISQTKFGSGNIDAKSYMTFLLRALGYDDSNGDFQWAQSLEKGGEIGIIEQSKVEELEKERFIRGDLAYLSYYTLNVDLKESDVMLKEKLHINLDHNISNNETIQEDNTINNELQMANIYSNAANLGRIIKKGDYLYFRDSQNGLIKHNTITNEKETIYNDGVVNNMNLIDNTIYFRDEVGIYYIDLSTYETECIHKFNYANVRPQAGMMFITGNEIYFKGSTFGIEKMNLDGSNHKVLYSSEIMDFAVYENKIYFIDKNQDAFYFMNTDGTDRKLFTDIEPWFYSRGSANDGWIYFRAKSPNPEYAGALYRIKPDGSGIECILEDCDYYNFIEDKIIFVVVDTVYKNNMRSETHKFYTSNLDGTNADKLMEGKGNVNNICVVDDKGIFYEMWVDDDKGNDGFYYLDLETLKNINFAEY